MWFAQSTVDDLKLIMMNPSDHSVGGSSAETRLSIAVVYTTNIRSHRCSKSQLFFSMRQSKLP